MRLIICEKDNAASRISSILGRDDVTVERHGRVPVYIFTWENELTKAIGLKGHILNMDYPEKYNNWSEVPPKDLIYVEPVRSISVKAIAGILKDIASSATSIYVATDYDREGELIGAEAVEYALGPEAIDTVWRARFSSLTPDEINDSFDNLVKMDKALVSAAETRQVIDLVWGATLTRFISLASRRMGQDFLSVGRVQSPTLALIVDKEREIRAFKPQAYWRIEAMFESGSTLFEGAHSEGDIFDGERAASIYASVKGEKEGRISSVQKKQRKDQPPHPFNTTQLIRAANQLGMSAARIMSVAEDLYTNGFISYPRTDNTVYPSGLDIRKTVQMLAQGPYSQAASWVLGQEKIAPTKGPKETTDHPPVYPTSYATKEGLGPERFKVYDLVVRRFLATLMDASTVELTSVKVDVKGEVFGSSGIRMIWPGWRSIYQLSEVKETYLPELEEGQVIGVRSLDLLQKETKPPKRISQGGLVQEMERLGLGTKSTRHEIIQKLYDRRYIDDSPPRPTLSGEALMNSLEKHAHPITEPGMTSTLEADMEKIANHELKSDDVISESREMLKGIMDVLEEHKKAIGAEISEALMAQDVVGKCPRCSNDLLMVRSVRGKRYIRCSQHPRCSKSYPLPQKGKLTFDGDTCGTCRSPMMTMYRRRTRPLMVCVNPVCPSKESKPKEHEKREHGPKKVDGVASMVEGDPDGAGGA